MQYARMDLSKICKRLRICIGLAEGAVHDEQAADHSFPVWMVREFALSRVVYGNGRVTSRPVASSAITRRSLFRSNTMLDEVVRQPDRMTGLAFAPEAN